MHYFHRTSLPPDVVLQEADTFFGSRLDRETAEGRHRQFAGSIGRITIDVRPEGGHYTFVDARTDQVAESEADKLVKRFLAVVHRRAEPAHQLRGAY